MRWLRWSIGTSMTESKREQVFRGLGVSGGVAIGPIYMLQREDCRPPQLHDGGGGDARVSRGGGNRPRGQLEALIASQDKLAGEILEFQLALLDDDDMLAPVFRAIEGGTPWDEAWSAMLDREIAEYRPKWRRHAGGKGRRSGRPPGTACCARHTGPRPRATTIPPGSILVAADLTPSIFVDLDWEAIAGAVTLGGSPVSHVSILARARGINFMVGLNAKLDEIGQGDDAILDAAQGLLTLHPGSRTLASANVRIDAEREDRSEMEALLPRPAATAGGEPVKIMVNIDEPDRLDALSPDHCDGVGLTRTEFLFTAGHLPGEDEQLAFYRRLIAWAAGRPVTIRTLDAGGDKPIAGRNHRWRGQSVSRRAGPAAVLRASGDFPRPASRPGEGCRRWCRSTSCSRW